MSASIIGWLNQSLMLNRPLLDVSIDAGSSARSVAQILVDSGVQTSPLLLYGWFRLSGQSRLIKAGSYEIESGLTPITLLDKLVRGEVALRSVTLVEGWTFKQFRRALLKTESLVHDTQAMEPTLIMQKLGLTNVHPEGRFYPDTYTFSKGSSELALLRRAQEAMDKHLAQVWTLRDIDSPLKTPDDVLILASIIEKETGKESDRAMISSVFNNRLRIGMLLQTDPTVIYGLGEQFDGNLRRRDLLADTPWNTYTRGGLPPTPIAMPGKSALLAAVQPARSEALYFVAKGDGSSQFSDNLQAHNRAVNTYQRRQSIGKITN
jgi:UPF0755 protein